MLLVATETAEFRDQRGRADRLRTARLDRVDVDAENVALGRTVDGNRAALRVEKRNVKQFCRAVALGLDLSLERILGFCNDDIARSDTQHGFCVRAIDVVILSLFGLGQFVPRPRYAFATPLRPM